MFTAPAAMICWPVRELPVRLIAGTRGEATSARAPIPWDSLKTFTTPRGKLVTAAKVAHMRALVWAVNPGSLPTTVQPVASAGARLRMNSTTGEFHGAMIPATPTASRRTVV